jgi:hypothetical protein
VKNRRWRAYIFPSIVPGVDGSRKTDNGALAAMLTDVWQTDTLKDLLDLHHIDLPGMANN